MDDGRFWLLYGLLCAALAFMFVMLVVLTVGPANAQGLRCMPFAQMKAMLAGQYQEHEVAHGQVSPQQIFVLFASDRGKTWTMLAVDTKGKACPVAAGQHWTATDRGV